MGKKILFLYLRKFKSMFQPINISIDEFEITPLKGDDLERFDLMAEEIYAILSDEKTLHFIPEKG